MHGAVRRVIPVALRRWRGDLLSAGAWSEFAGFRRALRSERYDFVIDSQGLVKSALIARLALGPRHGFDRASAREPFAARFYDVRHAVPGALHAVERNRRLAAAALGYAPAGACDYGLRAAGEAPIALRPPYALLLTMTSREDKLWPEEHWRALGAALEARGVQCVLPWGSEEERRRCNRIAAGDPRRASCRAAWRSRNSRASRARRSAWWAWTRGSPISRRRSAFRWPACIAARIRR